MQTQSVFDAVPAAVRDLQKHWRLLGAMGLLFALMNAIMMLPGIMMDVAGIFEPMFQGQLPTSFQGMSNEQQTATVVQTGIFFMSTFVNAILWVGAMQLGLGLVDNKDVDIWDCLCSVENVPIAIAYGCFGVLSIPAFMCCFFPGILLAAACWHWPAAGIDRSCGVFEALGVSVGLFRTNIGGMLGFATMLIFCSAVGGLCYYAIAVVAFPFSIMASAHAYRIMSPSGPPPMLEE